MLLQLLLLSLTSIHLFTLPSVAVNTLSPGQLFTDNGQTLISSGDNFELGFFTPWNSNNRYIGIWFKKIPQLTPFWVANNRNPLTNNSGVLTVSRTGDVLITDNRTRIVLWSSNSSSTTVRNPILRLLDTGNLVVADGETGDDFLWQSFDYPCDTMIPGMKLGWDGATGRETWLTSWNSLTDASPGAYTYRIDPRGLPEIILRRGTEVTYRSGPWDGVRFGGGPALRGNSVMTPIFVYNTSGVYYAFVDESSTITRFVVNQTGQVKHLSWNPTRNEWVDMATMQEDNCDNFEHCGPNGMCNINNEPECRCPDGFRPSIPNDWQRFDWSDGCVPKVPLNCSRPQGFRLFSRVKLPASSAFLMNQTATASAECEAACLRNCSCVAYAKTAVSGCVVWFGDLLDIKEYDEGGQDLYLRLDASELLASNGNGKRTAIIVSVSVIAAVISLGLIGFLVWKWISVQRKVLKNVTNNPGQENDKDDLELPLYDFATISTATNNFSPTNKIGEGGFGPVHKGVLPNGQEIAVKRLSKDSGQGLKEFKNEVILYLKLQHRNLVRLHGCCIEGQERMLIYEYLPNKSLDLTLFNQTRGTSLDWGIRYDIIVGIARGLLYLHRDSRLRIIHRDLKASNILLDNEMNPKISDFGLAKTFGGDQSEENTNRIIGTYGYMSPEYAIDGLFSVKSDVFSFGVLVLEIVSGKKNRGFFHPDHDLNLLGHAWKLWIEGKPMSLMDECIEGPVNESEALRCIQMGLLCVQQRPEDRPTMSSVLLMLDSENPVLPQPKQPGFYTERFADNDSSSTGKFPMATSNEVTLTVIHGR